MPIETILVPVVFAIAGIVAWASLEAGGSVPATRAGPIRIVRAVVVAPSACLFVACLAWCNETLIGRDAPLLVAAVPVSAAIISLVAGLTVATAWAACERRRSRRSEVRSENR